MAPAGAVQPNRMNTGASHGRPAYNPTINSAAGNQRRRSDSDRRVTAAVGGEPPSSASRQDMGRFDAITLELYGRPRWAKRAEWRSGGGPLGRVGLIE
jgi:hypothetical protein